ncbi:UNVERIFIED_CONTAM: hypothetical protein HDU68_008811 [Siphonaria sp. JEL0065]|nr:hypothetical protein HDU68_008811 [Siphonaria sp. JEL0065]
MWYVVAKSSDAEVDLEQNGMLYKQATETLLAVGLEFNVNSGRALGFKPSEVRGSGVCGRMVPAMENISSNNCEEDPLGTAKFVALVSTIGSSIIEFYVTETVYLTIISLIQKTNAQILKDYSWLLPMQSKEACLALTANHLARLCFTAWTVNRQVTMGQCAHAPIQKSEVESRNY